MARKLLTLLLALTGSYAAMAQDPQFSQFYANPLYLNPAFAGVQRCPQVTLNYRNQFPSLGVYQTYSASYDQYFAGIKGGLGFMALRDDAGNGALTLTEVSAIYSYHLQVSRKFTLLAGFQGTLRQRALNVSDFTFPDQIDAFYGFVLPTNERISNQTNNQFDLSVGFLGFTEKFFVGVALHHLTQPAEGFLTSYQLPMKFTTHLGASIPLGRKRLHNSAQNNLIPNILFQNQGTFNQITYSLSFNRRAVTGGLGLRQTFNNPDALVVILGFSPEDWDWKLGYSYDYTISELSNIGGGAHELSLSYRFPCPTKKKRVQALKCPKF